ncbi:hypothetical protein FJTKL_14744 [Diaporthe vaccinii]|uniref:Remorin C-terminal domain-containing protein n=1 Tax=Diaporthe vaccinii TaxID=105482 RepID=A0ABR4F8A8_9PEZI
MVWVMVGGEEVHSSIDRKERFGGRLDQKIGFLRLIDHCPHLKTNLTDTNNAFQQQQHHASRLECRSEYSAWIQPSWSWPWWGVPTSSNAQLLQQPSAKRARQEETHEVMAEPAEPKPKPGTKEFALHKLNFHKQRMADAHEAKLAAEIRYAAEAEKAANWQLKVDEWEDKGSTSKTIEDDLAKLVNEKKAAMKKMTSVQIGREVCMAQGTKGDIK